MRLVFFVVLAALAAGAACYFVNHLTRRQERKDPVESHYWIHQQLKITEEQDRALEPAEQRFEHERLRLSEAILQGNKDLAEAIRSDKADSPKVREAMRKIHQAQGELQDAVVHHVFDMKATLTPAQFDRLIQLTAEALDRTPASK